MEEPASTCGIRREHADTRSADRCASTTNQDAESHSMLRSQALPNDLPSLDFLKVD